MAARLAVEKLRREHALDQFDCGDQSLNRFLVRFALGSQFSGASQTYVGLADETVIGFYTLVVGDVAYADAPERLTKGLARHPVPIMLLARLAVGTGWQGRGIGAALLKGAMRRTLQAADIAGIRAFAVHAKNDLARCFYEHFGFVPAPSDDRHLFLLIKDVRRAMEE